MIKSVLLRGPILTHSGYGENCRQIAKWLFSLEDQGKIKIYTELLNWGVTPWITKRDKFVDRLIQASIITKPAIFDVSIQAQLPNEWNPVLGIQNIGVTAGVESTKCNPEWIKACDRMDLIIVPSKFTSELFAASKTPIRVVPHCLNQEILNSNILDKEELLSGIETDFNFLFVGMFTGNNEHNDRKNILYMMKWFLEAFKDNTNVGLVVKTSMARLGHLDRDMITKNFKDILEGQLGYTGNGPKIYLLHGNMSETEMSKLYRDKKIKAFISANKGEGFGIPFLEAAASGLPIIATDWSAYKEFLDKGKWIKIANRLEEIHQSRIDNNIWIQGSKWAMPIEDDFKTKILKFYSSPEKPNEWAKDLSKIIKNDYSQSKINDLFTEVTKDLI